MQADIDMVFRRQLTTLLVELSMNSIVRGNKKGISAIEETQIQTHGAP